MKPPMADGRRGDYHVRREAIPGVMMSGALTFGTTPLVSF